MIFKRHQVINWQIRIDPMDRLTIPADAMARITEALSTGGSIIVSDQGINQGETGEGTDFIVSLR